MVPHVTVFTCSTDVRRKMSLCVFCSEQEASPSDETQEIDDGKEENLEELYKARAMDDWKDGKQNTCLATLHLHNVLELLFFFI